MPSIDIQLRRGELRAAAALPQLIDGAALGPPEYRLKQRPNGVYAIFEGAKYVKTTGLRDKPMAGEFLEIFRLQQEARSEGIIDARYVQADVIADYYLEQIPTAAAGVRRNDTHRLRRLRPEFAGKRLCDLTGARRSRRSRSACWSATRRVRCRFRSRRCAPRSGSIAGITPHR